MNVSEGAYRVHELWIPRSWNFEHFVGCLVGALEIKLSPLLE